MIHSNMFTNKAQKSAARDACRPAGLPGGAKASWEARVP